jgi:hypothetical protein
MSFEMPEAWSRERVNDEIIWKAKMELKCYHCGEVAKVMMIANEGKYSEDKWERVKTDNGVMDVYPSLAPPKNCEAIVLFPDEEWSMMCHLTRNFFPFETCQAIRLGSEPLSAFLHWYKEVGTQFGEWICPKEECCVETARALWKEKDSINQMVGNVARVK